MFEAAVIELRKVLRLLPLPDLQVKVWRENYDILAKVWSSDWEEGGADCLRQEKVWDHLGSHWPKDFPPVTFVFTSPFRADFEVMALDGESYAHQVEVERDNLEDSYHVKFFRKGEQVTHSWVWCGKVTQMSAGGLAPLPPMCYQRALQTAVQDGSLNLSNLVAWGSDEDSSGVLAKMTNTSDRDMFMAWRQGQVARELEALGLEYVRPATSMCSWDSQSWLLPHWQILFDMGDLGHMLLLLREIWVPDEEGLYKGSTGEAMTCQSCIWYWEQKIGTVYRQGQAGTAREALKLWWKEQETMLTQKVASLQGIQEKLKIQPGASTFP